MLSHTHTVADEDGPQEVSKCTCTRCGNHWWVRCAREHQPSYCPYCGLKFLFYDNGGDDYYNIAGLPLNLPAQNSESEGESNG